MPETERLTSSVVLVGKFNPAIFSPAWIRKINLVDDEACDAATVSIIHPDVTVFQAGGFSFDVRPDRFAVEVASEPLVRALDATQVIFGEFLAQTPVSELGINYTEHFRLDSARQRVSLGRELAPLKPWGAWGAEIDALSGPLVSGMIALTMVQMYDPAGSGERRVDVQPSRYIEQSELGVFALANEHRILIDYDDTAGAAPAMDLLQDRFDASIIEARTLIDGLKAFAGGLPS